MILAPSLSRPPHAPPPSAPGAGLARLLGALGERQLPGDPTLIVLGGLHGNEPAGVRAAERLLAWLGEARPPLRGRLVALAGNLEALAAGRRYIDQDLNRIWTEAGLARLRQSPGAAADPDAGAEAREMAELYALLWAEIEAAEGPVYIIDAHTTSSQSAPFILFGDTLPNRAFARRFPVPLVLGLEEQVEGTLLSHLVDIGCIAIGVEGGQHDDPSAIDNLEAVLRLALIAAGMLPPEAMPDQGACRDRLARSREGLPGVMEVRHRHPVAPEDRFAMRPGYLNFQPIAAGEILAGDRRGPVRAVEAGRILMPLYQGQGEDGYFITRPISPAWLGVSELLRRLPLRWLLPILPGVARHPDLAGALVVDTRVARFFPLQVFHLLGYRKQTWSTDRLVIRRRRQRRR